jgi:hypothetical protein
MPTFFLPLVAAESMMKKFLLYMRIYYKQAIATDRSCRKYRLNALYYP